jgi:hypothetical protein
VNENLDKILDAEGYSSPALSALPSGKNFPLLHFSGFPQDVPALFRL